MFSSCGLGEWDITLYEQKIEGTSKALYDYDAWGGRDSHISGYAILDTSEVFTIGKIKKLSFNHLADIPTKNSIKTIATEFMPYEERKTAVVYYEPLRTEEFTTEGFKIEKTYYQGKGLKERTLGSYNYVFQRFKETRDSLFFYDLNDVPSKAKKRYVDSLKLEDPGLEHLSFNAPHLDTLRVKKGNIIIRQSESKEIYEIIVEDLIFSSDGQGEIISIRSYRLKPKTETKSDAFSDYGIYKEKQR